jgi:uncharacterized protein YdaU (DUF1376 family)
MSAAAPWYKYYVDDFEHGTRDMSCELFGAYQRLVNRMYSLGGPIADDKYVLARACQMTLQQWEKVKTALIAMGKIVVTADGRLSNGRMIKELLKQKEAIERHREAQSRGGRRAAETRKQQRAADVAAPAPEPPATEPSPKTCSETPQQTEDVFAEKSNENSDRTQVSLETQNLRDKSTSLREVSRAGARALTRAKRGKGLIPDDWQPTEKAFALGASLGMDRARVEDEAERLRDWAIFHQTRGVDWDRRFSLWLRNARPPSLPALARPTQPRKSGYEQRREEIGYSFLFPVEGQDDDVPTIECEPERPWVMLEAGR